MKATTYLLAFDKFGKCCSSSFFILQRLVFGKVLDKRDSLERNKVSIRGTKRVRGDIPPQRAKTNPVVPAVSSGRTLDHPAGAAVCAPHDVFRRLVS